MKVWRSIFVLLGLTALAGEDPNRLSWSHYDYLKGGFNNVPWVRDPFFPQEKKFRLSGIISAELAFVNGKWVKQGDFLDGYVVKSVTQNTVALMKQGELVLLRLHE